MKTAQTYECLNCLGVGRNTGKYVAGNISQNCASIFYHKKANVKLLNLVCVYCMPHAINANWYDITFGGWNWQSKDGLNM